MYKGKYPRKRVDVCVFGCTGYIGELVCQYLSTHPLLSHVSVALAGRCLPRIEAMRVRLGLAKAGEGTSGGFHNGSIGARGIEVYFADLNNRASLSQMCSKAQVIVDCTSFSGVSCRMYETCLQHRCDYINLAMDSVRVAQIVERFKADILRKGILVVNSCGVYNTIADLAVLYALEEHEEQDCDEDSSRAVIQQWWKENSRVNLGNESDMGLSVLCRYVVQGGNGCLSIGLWQGLFEAYLYRCYCCQGSALSALGEGNGSGVGNKQARGGGSCHQWDAQLPYYSEIDGAWCIPIAKSRSLLSESFFSDIIYNSPVAPSPLPSPDLVVSHAHEGKLPGHWLIHRLAYKPGWNAEIKERERVATLHLVGSIYDDGERRMISDDNIEKCSATMFDFGHEDDDGWGTFDASSREKPGCRGPKLRSRMNSMLCVELDVIFPSGKVKGAAMQNGNFSGNSSSKVMFRSGPVTRQMKNRNFVSPSHAPQRQIRTDNRKTKQSNQGTSIEQTSMIYTDSVVSSVSVKGGNLHDVTAAIVGEGALLMALEREHLESGISSGIHSPVQVFGNRLANGLRASSLLKFNSHVSSDQRC
eukprot:Nk52_evm9s261 gene=Nk52_evmTU9s261